MWIVILLILLVAAVFGVLATVLKLALAIVLSVVLAILVLGVIAAAAFRRSVGRFRTVGGSQRGFDARGWIRDDRESGRDLRA